MLFLGLHFYLPAYSQTHSGIVGGFLRRARQMLRWNLALVFTCAQHMLSPQDNARCLGFFFSGNGGD